MPETTTTKVGRCDFKQYEHCGPHERIPEIGQRLPPFGCKNWKPDAAIEVEPSTAEVTPRPWRVDKEHCPGGHYKSPRDYVYVYDANGDSVFGEYEDLEEASAVLITTAVNSYDATQKQLAALRGALGELIHAAEFAGIPDKAEHKAVGDALEVARAALKDHVDGCSCFTNGVLFERDPRCDPNAPLPSPRNHQ